MKNLLTLTTVLATALILSLPSGARAETYKIDSEHTNVGFKVKHMMVSWTHGEFREVDGVIEFDPENIEDLSADITIQVESVDTDNDRRDNHLRGGDFFAAKKFPEMTFVSTGVRNVTSEGFDLVGDLTIRGVTNEVVLAVDGPWGPFRNPMGQEVTGFHAETSVNRIDFGLDWNMPVQGGVVVGEEVIITIDIELIRKKA